MNPDVSVSATSSSFDVPYDREFFCGHADGSQRSAEIIVPLILSCHSVRSVIDVGCGIGTWAAVFRSRGVADVHGVDGAYVDRSLLRIPAGQFTAADLTQPLTLGRRFDIAVCLEVAEHLPVDAASVLIASLTTLADTVLFSAATPGQGGTGHVNEQWPEYWARLFLAHGYLPRDWIRSKIWNHREVRWWYAQNMIMYARSESAGQVLPFQNPRGHSQKQLRRLIHHRSPQFHRLSLAQSSRSGPGIASCVWALAKSVRNRSRRIGREN